jgi:hypothetical protein
MGKIIDFPLIMRKSINEWAKGKPLGLVMIAQQFAGGAEPCFEFLKLKRS